MQDLWPSFPLYVPLAIFDLHPPLELIMIPGLGLLDTVSNQMMTWPLRVCLMRHFHSQKHSYGQFNQIFVRILGLGERCTNWTKKDPCWTKTDSVVCVRKRDTGASQMWILFYLFNLESCQTNVSTLTCLHQSQKWTVRLWILRKRGRGNVVVGLEWIQWVLSANFRMSQTGFQVW